jgi:hypothetical protein
VCLIEQMHVRLYICVFVFVSVSMFLCMLVICLCVPLLVCCLFTCLCMNVCWCVCVHISFGVRVCAVYSWLKCGLVVSCCQYGNKCLAVVKGVKFFDKLKRIHPIFFKIFNNKQLQG